MRSFSELSAEYVIRLTTHEKTGAEVVTIVVEYVKEEAISENFKDKLKYALREDLGVTPEVEIVKPNTLARTEFKAKRIEDRRRKDNLS